MSLTRQGEAASARPPLKARVDAVLETSMGPVTFELYYDHAPKTCQNFAELCRRGYYSGTPFHRIIGGFMIQGGDPTGTGRGGTSVFGGTFEDEIVGPAAHGAAKNPQLRFVGAGVLAMANSGPNTNGSQFFITLAPTPHLDKKHTIFGRVKTGMRVVERLSAVEVDVNDRPKDSVTVMKSRVQSIAGDDEQEV